MATEQLIYPQWTEYRKKSGLDPLGMQNSSINLYQRLLPGISNVTLRIRYYGFYSWAASPLAKFRERSFPVASASASRPPIKAGLRKRRACPINLDDGPAWGALEDPSSFQNARRSRCLSMVEAPSCLA